MNETIFKEQKQAIERLRQIREDMGYSQEGFSDALGISSSNYVKVENYDRRLSLNNLKRLHDRFDISADYILFGDELTLDNVWFSVSNCSDIDKIRLFSRLVQYFGGYEPGARWGNKGLSEDFVKIVSDIMPDYDHGNDRES